MKRSYCQLRGENSKTCIKAQNNCLTKPHFNFDVVLVEYSNSLGLQFVF